MDATQHPRRAIAGSGASLLGRLKGVVSGVAFWTGIVAPFAYLLLVVPGVRVQARFTTLLALVGVHYLALILGHPHRRQEA